MRFNKSFENITFSTPFLALDSECYNLNQPLPLEAPYLVSFNANAAALIGLDDRQQFVETLNTTFKPEGVMYYSSCYAGHQFGHYNPRLGDGRVHHLGSVNGWQVQLKGSGETIYARTADGRTTLRSSIREYLMSEAMHALNIPTTRALGIIGSDETILRSGFEKSAITMRLSSSWVRFGSFEYFYYLQDFEKLKMMMDYAITESYPHLKSAENSYFQLFTAILERTAQLVAHWQAVGFCHGVLNTDNMSIAGLTLDYGPFSMLDEFAYQFVCNSTDKAGRYAYSQQPNVTYWNVTMLAKTFTPFVEQAALDEALRNFGETLYPNYYLDAMRKKLGLDLKREDDALLITELVGALQDAQIDYTLFFRTLSRYDGERMPLFELAMNPIVLDSWLTQYDARLEHEQQTLQTRHRAMLQSNPKYIMRSYLLDEATQKALRGDFTMVNELLHVAQHPFDELESYEAWAQEPPLEQGNQMRSCSS